MAFLPTTIVEDAEPAGPPVEINAEDPDTGRPQIPATPPAPPSAYVPPASHDPGPSQEPQPAPGAVSPPPASPDHYDWRWRQDSRQIPGQALREVAGALGAQDPRQVITWTQQGRDLNYHRAVLDAREAELQQLRQQLEDQAQQIREQQMDRQGQAYGPPPMYPGAPGYGAPTAPAPYSGGYGYPYAPHPGGTGPANPYGQPPASGGYPSYVVPFAPAAPLPQDPRAREEMALQGLLSLPHALQAQFQGLVNEFRQERQERKRGEIAAAAREEDSKIQGAATSYIENLKTQGYQVPPELTPDRMLNEAAWLGLPANPHLPWNQIFDTIAARHIWRYAHEAGAGEVSRQLETDRASTFRVPAASKPPAASVAGGSTGNPLLDRIAAARELGNAVSVREAFGR